MMTPFDTPLFSNDLIVGSDSSHMVLLSPELSKGNIRVHSAVVEPLTLLAQEAAKKGFQLKVISGFRDFDRQLQIWNAKALGQRPVLGIDEKPLNLSEMVDAEKVFALLNWSALPGASRHHWGTDVDVYDASVVPLDYAVQLTSAEAKTVFGLFHDWLSQYVVEGRSGFYRPYFQSAGSVAEELWHLSYKPLASPVAEALSETALRVKIESADIQLKSAILENLSEIYARYIAPYRVDNV